MFKLRVDPFWVLEEPSVFIDALEPRNGRAVWKAHRHVSVDHAVIGCLVASGEEEHGTHTIVMTQIVENFYCSGPPVDAVLSEDEQVNDDSTDDDEFWCGAVAPDTHHQKKRKQKKEKSAFFVSGNAHQQHDNTDEE